MCIFEKFSADIFSTFSLTDPETFMAKAGRQSAAQPQSIKQASEIVSSDKAEHALPSGQRVVSASSENLVMLASNDTASNVEQILPAPNNQKDIMPARPPMAHSESNIQEVYSETSVRDPLSDQLNRTTQASVTNDTAVTEKQRATEQDREKLQRLRGIVAQLGGLSCADILSHIETLERQLSPSATADLEIPNVGETELLKNVPAPAVNVQADPVFDQSAHSSATAWQELSPDTSSQPKVVKVQAGPSDSRNPVSNAQATGVSAVRTTETATAAHKDQRMLTANAKATAAAAAPMHIKGMKHNTVKIGAIFGEHIQMSHFLARPPNDSIATSVASTADDIGSVSASFSRLTLQQRDSSHSITAVHSTTETAAMNHAPTQPPKSLEEKRSILSQNKPTTPGSLEDATARQSLPNSTSVEGFRPMTALSPPDFNKPSAFDEPTATPQITMRKDPKLADNVFTRQYSSHAAVSPQLSPSSQSRVVNKPSSVLGPTANPSTLNVQQPELKENRVSRQPATYSQGGTEPRYASTNPFAQQKGSVEVSSVQSGSSARNDTSSFSKRFDTAPYRRDETSTLADRIQDSSAGKPKPKPKPKIPDFLRTLRAETQDPGAAARRQYEDAVNSPSTILSERVRQQMNSSQASSIGSGFQNARASIMASSPLARPSQGPATSENMRPSDKKASQNAARYGPK